MASSGQGGAAEVKARLDMLELVGRYVNLRASGSGRWVAPCPFHQETKPSFSVVPDKGFFHCFGCGASGDLIDFYCKINGLEFKEGLKQLAEMAGVELAWSKPDPGAEKRRRRRLDSLAAHKLAQEHYRANLIAQAGRTAADYIARRGLSPDVVESFGLGASLDAWHALENHLKAQGFSQDKGVEAGLLVRNEQGRIYDRFRGRLMFPIQNLTGQVIAFGARTLTGDDPKYLNSSESDIYVKGDNLYGLFQARRTISQTQTSLITEGYTDVISLHQFGFTGACGVLGTALTESQVRRLGGFCSKVELVFDGDDAGRKAALRGAEMLLAGGLSCAVVLLPQGEDVDSLLQKDGADAFQALRDKASDGLDYCLETIRAGFSPSQIMDWAKGFLQGLKRSDLRAFYIPRLASGLSLSEAELRGSMDMAATGRQTAPAGPRPAGTVRSPRDNFDRWVLRFAIRNPKHIPDLADMGLRDVLSKRARPFWDLLSRYEGSDEILPALDEPHKRFYVTARLEPDDDEAETQRQWQDIRATIEREQKKRMAKGYQDAIRRAEAGGDQTEVLRLLKLQQEMLREGR